MVAHCIKADNGNRVWCQLLQGLALKQKFSHTIN